MMQEQQALTMPALDDTGALRFVPLTADRVARDYVEAVPPVMGDLTRIRYRHILRQREQLHHSFSVNCSCALCREEPL